MKYLDYTGFLRFVDKIKFLLSFKVDKEEGKGLFSGNYYDLINKPNIPSKTSQLINDNNYVVNTDARLSNARPASDVASWAKQPKKPTYTADEVGALGAGATAANSTKLAGLTLQQVQASVKPTVGIISTLASLPVAYTILNATLSVATNLSLSAAMEVGQLITIIITPTSDITQPLPITGDLVSLDGDNIKITNGKLAEISLLCYAPGKISISSKISA